MRSGLACALLFILAVTMAGQVGAAAESANAAKTAATAAPATAPAAPGTDQGTGLHREQDILDRDLKHLGETTRLRIEALEKQIAAQEKHFDDLLSAGDRISYVITLLAIFIGLATAAAGFTAYFSARKLAEDVVEKWIAKEGAKLLKELTAGAKHEIDQMVNDAGREIRVMLEDFRAKGAAIDEIFDRISGSVARREEAAISPGDKIEIAHAARDAKAKPDSEKMFPDWFSVGIDAYLEDDYLRAAEAYNHAANSKDATRVQTARALVNKGVALENAGKLEDAIAASDEVVRRFGDAEEPALREAVAGARFNKGVALGKDGKLEDAFATYDVLVRRFADAEEPALLGQHAMALGGRAYFRLCLAKRSWRGPDGEEEARALLSQALTDADAALNISPDNTNTLGNKGYTLYLLGRTEEAEPVLRRALELGGEKARDGELKDADIHPLPQDEPFKELIHRLWEEVSGNN